MYVIDGNDLGIENITNIFSLPFVEPPTDHSYATEKLIPMIPALLYFGAASAWSYWFTAFTIHWCSLYFQSHYVIYP